MLKIRGEVMINKKQFRIFTVVDLDKEEEYLHEMHLKGWRYRTNRFGFFYFEQCQPDDVIYHIYDSRFLKKYKHELQDFRNSGWELIETGFCSILRKPASDILSEEKSLYEVRVLDGKLCGLDFVPVYPLSLVVLLFA